MSATRRLSYMIGETNRERDQGERRICMSAGRKRRAAGNEQIVHTEDLALAIYHALIRTRGHPGCAKWVGRVVEGRIFGTIVSDSIHKLGLGQTSACQGGIHSLAQLDHRATLRFTDLPINHGEGHTQRVDPA